MIPVPVPIPVPVSEVVERLLAAYGQADFAHVLADLRGHLDLETVRVMARRVGAEQLRNAQQALHMAQATQATAAALADSPDKVLAQGLAHWVTGNALYYLSDYRAALEYYHRAQTIYASAGRRQTVIGLQINQVGVLQEMGAYQSALDLAEEARRACEDLGEPGWPSLAILEMNVGSAWQQLGEPAQALAAYERGRTLFVRLGDEVQTARMDINRANVLEEMDRFDQADALLRRARELLQRSGQAQEVARADLNLGRLAYRRGQYQHALTQLEAARGGFAAIPNLTEVALVDLHRSFVYRDLNLLQESITLAGQALDRAGTHWQQAQALIVQGIGYRRLGIYAEADRLLAKARRLLHQQGAHTRLQLLDVERAQLALVQGRVATARRLARRVTRQIHSREWPSLTARLHLILARCALAGDAGAGPAELAAAEGEVTQALAIVADHPEAETAIQARHLLGQIFQRRGDLDGACVEVRAAIHAVESLRARLPMDEFQMGFMEDKLPLYADLVRLSRRLGPPDQVLFALNLASSAPLSHLTVPTALQREEPDQADLHLQAQIQSLREQWHWYQAKMERPFELDETGADPAASPEHLRTRLLAIEDQLADLSRRWRVRRAGDAAGVALPPLPGSQADAAHFAQQVRAALGRDELLLHYFVAEEHFHVAVVSPTQTTLVADLAPVGTMQRLLKSWRFQMEHVGAMGGGEGDSPAVQRVLGHLTRLHGALVAPLSPHLAAPRRIYLVLPPGWHDLPFAAFHDGREHLVARHDFVHLSAPDVLLQPAAASDASASALVLGYSDENRLTHTAAEAAQVAATLSPRFAARTLVEGDATLAAFRSASRSSRLLHLATHALFRPDNPLFSWIRLADARLTVAELYEISLPQRPLVVLSACETGRGTPRGGGLLGMGRGFLAAGATGLVVSLWKVADQPSAQLMADFYAQLVDGGLADPAASLAAAQRLALADHPHPFYWAGFVFIRG